MDYRIKLAMQRLISIMPGTYVLNRFMQRYIAGSLPISDAVLDARAAIAGKHLDKYFKQHGVMPKTVLDIGSGSDLSLPILMSKKCERITASDIRRLAAKDLVDDILKRLGLESIDALGIS